MHAREEGERRREEGKGGGGTKGRRTIAVVIVHTNRIRFPQDQIIFTTPAVHSSVHLGVWV